MNAIELKEYLSQDPDRIVKVLDDYKFHDFNIYPERITCALPDGDNTTSVNIYYDNEYLNGVVWTRNAFKADIFGIITEFCKVEFKDLLKHIHNIFGLNYKFTKKIETFDTLIDLKYYNQLKKQRKSIDFNSNNKYDNSVLKSYIPYPHIELFQEGIFGSTIKKFNIHTDLDSYYPSILFPHYDWLETDKIVGIQARRIGLDHYTAKQLGIPKYMNYIEDYKKEMNLYGWAQNQENITKKKELIIFESEKSVLKDDVFKLGNGNAVALGGHHLSKAQTVFISRFTPSDTKVILAFDNDIMKDDDKYYRMLENVKELSSIRDTYIMRENATSLLDDKDAPIDKGYRIYNYLYENCCKKI